MDAYWKAYAMTLARIRDERPTTLAELKAILDEFSIPQGGAAFFPNGADDTLSDALYDAGWAIEFIESDYLWNARSPRPVSETIHFVEGDVYAGEWVRP